MNHRSYLALAIPLKTSRVLIELVSMISKPLDQHVAEEILNHDEIRSIRDTMLEKLTIAETLMVDSLGRRILQELDKEGDSDNILNDGALHDYTGFDLVWIASLVPDKEEILERIYQSNPDATVAIRSVHGIHQLLYEPVDATKFSKVAWEVGRTIADSFIINSTIYYTFK